VKSILKHERSPSGNDRDRGRLRGMAGPRLPIGRTTWQAACLFRHLLAELAFARGKLCASNSLRLSRPDCESRTNLRSAGLPRV
jgi:hypothetical protein